MNLKSKIFYWYVACTVLFAGITLIPAPDTATLTKYHLTAGELRGLDVTIIIMEALIWYAAFYGYDRLRRYSQLIKADAEGKHINTLSRGLLLLSIGLPISAIVSSLLTLIASHHPDFTAASIIIRNYFSVIFPLIAFLFINVGARNLGNLGKTRPRLLYINIIVLSVLILGVIFCCLIVLEHKELRTTYHLSPELVMLTLGIPYMYTWFLGLFAVAELQKYSSKVAGILYRKGWNLLIGGLAAIIFLSIAIQYLATLSSWITSLSLGSLLLLLYVLLLLLVGAYIVLALGAQRLMKIEEA
jgi:uncharacterized ParB-like nuclease family protein